MPFYSAGESASATTAGAGAVEIAFDMNPRRQYAITAKGAALWFRVVVAGASGTAAAQVAGSGSHYIQPGMPPFPVAAIGIERNPVDGTANAKFRGRISIIRDGATDATGILSEIPTVQPQ